MANLVLALNLKTKGVTQYTGYDLEGACVNQAGQPWGALYSGIQKLEEPVHDEGHINAWAKLPNTDLNNPNQKRLRSLLVAGEAEDDLLLDVAMDEDPATQRTITVDKLDLSQAGAKAKGRRDQLGRHFQVTVRNQNGADFSLDAIDVLPVLLQAKPRRR